MKLLKKLFGGESNEKPVIIVSGLPRSGTSMMMKMVEAGGLAVLTDNIRTADDDNPKGYYEYERVKQLPQDTDWLPEARGRVVKIISMLLQHLPGNYRFKVLFMRREINEILASQRQMLIRRGEATDKVADEQMAEMYAGHIRKIEAWLAEQKNIDVLYVDYNDVLQNGAAWIEKINAFLGGGLAVDKMQEVIDLSLYRQRKE